MMMMLLFVFDLTVCTDTSCMTCDGSKCYRCKSGYVLDASAACVGEQHGFLVIFLAHNRCNRHWERELIRAGLVSQHLVPTGIRVTRKCTDYFSVNAIFGNDNLEFGQLVGK